MNKLSLIMLSLIFLNCSSQQKNYDDEKFNAYFILVPNEVKITNIKEIVIFGEGQKISNPHYLDLLKEISALEFLMEYFSEEEGTKEKIIELKVELNKTPKELTYYNVIFNKEDLEKINKIIGQLGGIVIPSVPVSLLN